MQPTIYWIEAPWLGRLAIVPRPRGGDWLEDEARAWRTAGIDVVVSLLEENEAQDFDIAGEGPVCTQAGLDFVAFPIPDRGVPSSRKAVEENATRLVALLNEGKTVAVHCRQGIGRSSLLAGTLLILGCLSAEQAVERISKARGLPVPETKEQRDWLYRFARERSVATTK